MYITQSNLTKSKILQADWLTVNKNEKATLHIREVAKFAYKKREA